MKKLITQEKFDLRKQYQKYGIEVSLQDKIENLYPYSKDKFKLWLSRQVKNNHRVLDRVSDIQGIIDYVHSPFTHKVDYGLDFDAMANKQEQWHKELAKKSGFILEEKNKVIKEYGDGFYWVDMATTQSKEEALLMGHCGSDHCATTLICLRYKHAAGHIEGILTAAYNEYNKTITQLKGKKNSKPKKVYHPYIISLFTEVFVDIKKKKISDYKPEFDFHFGDLPENKIHAIFEKQPSLKEGFYEDMFALTGKDKYLRKLIDNKEFKEKFDNCSNWFKENFTMKTGVDKNNISNEFFFNKDGKVKMENLHQYAEFFVDYKTVWSKIESEFSSNQLLTNNLIRSIVATVFKIKPFKASALAVSQIMRWEQFSNCN